MRALLGAAVLAAALLGSAGPAAADGLSPTVAGTVLDGSKASTLGAPATTTPVPAPTVAPTPAAAPRPVTRCAPRPVVKAKPKPKRHRKHHHHKAGR